MGTEGSAGIPARLRLLIEQLASIPDRVDRIALLIDIASRFRNVPPGMASRPFPEVNKAPGCESEVYVWAEPNADGTLQFHFVVENPQGITARALAVILDETCSGAPLAEVAEVSRDVVQQIFGAELSMGKSLGLTGIAAMVQSHARRRLGTDRAFPEPTDEHRP